MTRTDYDRAVAKIGDLLFASSPAGDEFGAQTLPALAEAQRELERLITRVADDIAHRDPPAPDSWTPASPVRDVAPDGSTYDEVAQDLKRGDL